MKLLSNLVLLFVFIINTLSAQINPKIPDWVNIIDIKNVGPVNKNQIKEGFYYIIIDEQYNTIKKHNYFHFAKSVLTEEALTDVSQIEFSYDPTYEKAHLHYVRIHRGNELIDKTKNLEFKILNEESQRNKGVLSGKKTFYANLSDVRKGDIIEYSFSFIGVNPIMANFFNYNLSLSYSVPIGKIYLRILFPKETKPSIAYKNTQLKPIIIQTNLNDYVWEVNNPQPITLESSVPNWYSSYASIEISNLSSWNEVKSHCRTFFNLPQYNNSELKLIIDSIVNPSDNIESQISSIVEFVQTNIRYSGNENGIYSHIPRTPDFVLKNRYGDCKEKSVLLNELLKLIEIKSYPVLINSSLGSKIHDLAPSINAFDHCISAFSYNNQLCFIDPTISYQRGQFNLRIIPPYETGMLLDDKTEPFTKIPIDVSSKSEIIEEFEIEDSGDTKLKAISKYSGANADEIRYTFLTNSIYEIQDSYKKFYEKYCDNIIVLDTVTFIDNTESNEFTITENYLLKNFWSLEDSSKSKIITKQFMPHVLNSKLNYGEENKRKDPLKIFYPLNLTQTITLTKKGGWDIKNDLKKENNKFFDYSYSKETEGNSLKLVYSYKSKTGVIAPEEYADYKSKMDFINYNIVLSLEEKQLITGVIGFNWALVLTLLSGFVFSSIIIWYLYKQPHDSNFDKRYDSIQGWLVIVGIVLTLNPITLLFSLYNQCEGEMGVNYAVYFFSEESTYFSPMRGYFSLFVTFINTLMLTFSIFVVIIFYQKKASFRPYYSFFRIFNAIFLIINLIILNSYYGDSNLPEERAMLSTETSGMIRVFIQTCIWVPYIWFSERSKHTFTN